MFGDPCAGTHKYLEAHYQCLPGKSTFVRRYQTKDVIFFSFAPNIIFSIQFASSVSQKKNRIIIRTLKCIYFGNIETYFVVNAITTATTTTTTSRPSPPWLITSQPPMWSTVKPSARPPPLPSKVSATPPPPPPSKTGTTIVSSTFVKTSTSQAIQPPQQNEDIDEEQGFDQIPDEITTLPFTTVTPRKITCKF